MIELYSDLDTLVGTLTDCIRCEVSEEANTSFELSMEYPVNGTLADSLAVEKWIKCKPNPYDTAQFFRIYRVSRTIDGIISVYAEHISYMLNNFVCRAASGTTIAELIQHINSEAAYNSTFNQGYTVVCQYDGTYSPADWEIVQPTTVRELMSLMSKLWIGTWKFNNGWATFYYSRGADRGVALQYGVNITDFVADVDISGNYTHVFPYWTGTDENGNEVTVYANPLCVQIGTENHSYYKPYILNLSGQFETVPDSASLTLKAQEFAALNYWSIGAEIADYSVDVIQRGKTLEGAYLTDADHVEIGDTVQIAAMGVSTSRRCIATKYDVIGDRLTAVVLGKKQSSITDLVSPANKSKAEETETEETTESDPLENKIPDSIVKVSDNEVYAMYGTTKVTWTADGTGDERHNFRKKVSTATQ